MVALLLCGPMDRIGHAIDRATGNRGICHVCVATDIPGWLVEISRERGVELQTVDAVIGERYVERIELDGQAGSFLLSRIERRLGERYNFVAMLAQPLQSPSFGGTYCSTVVADSLPAHLRSQLPTLPAPADFRRLRGMRGTR